MYLNFNLVYLMLTADQFLKESGNAQYPYGPQQISPTKLHKWETTFSR